MSKHYLQWNAAEVSSWVAKIGPDFLAIANEFKDAGVSGGFLTAISDDDLQEMGLESEVFRKTFKQNVTTLVEAHDDSKRAASRHPEGTPRSRVPKRHPLTNHVHARSYPGSDSRSDASVYSLPPTRIIYQRPPPGPVPPRRISRKVRKKKSSPTSPSSNHVPSYSVPRQHRHRRNHPLQYAPPHPMYYSSTTSPYPQRHSPRHRHVAVHVSPTQNPQKTPRRKKRRKSKKGKKAVSGPHAGMLIADPHTLRQQDPLKPPDSYSPARSSLQDLGNKKFPFPRQNIIAPSRTNSPSPTAISRAEPSPSVSSTTSRPARPARPTSATLPIHQHNKQQKQQQKPPHRKKQPVISGSRKPNPKKPRPSAKSMKTAVSLPSEKKSHNRKPNFAVVSVEPAHRNSHKNTTTIIDKWIGHQPHTSHSSLLSLSSTQPSSMSDSGHSGLSRSRSGQSSLENSDQNSVSTSAEDKESDIDIEAKLHRNLLQPVLDLPEIGGGFISVGEHLQPPPRLSLALKEKHGDGTSEKPAVPSTATRKLDEFELNSVLITLQRPKNAEEAFLEFSNAIAICVCSLQLGYEYLELLFQLSDRLYGREQVNYDLSQGEITRSLASNYEFLQLLNLLGFSLEGDVLVCRQKPHEQVLKVFQKYIREYQFAGFDTYSTEMYKDILDQNALKMLQIVMAVTHDNARTNDDLMRSFVIFMPYLCDVNTMLELLQFWYEQCEKHFDNPSNVKTATATLLKHLIEYYKFDVLESEVYESLVYRIQEEDPVSFSHIESVIRASNSNVQTMPFLLQNTISTVSNLFDLSAQMLADNLTLSNFNLFASIPLMDFFEQNHNTSKLAEFMTRYENVQRWVRISIYQAENVDARAARIRTFFKAAERMWENQDVFGFFALFRGLSSPEVQSFDSAWKQVFVKKFRSKRDYSKLWIEWKMSCEKRGKATELFWKLRPPGIPNAHVISAHMEWIPKYQEISHDAVELFCQLRKLYPFIKKLQKLQKVHFNLKADISVINALEAEFLQQSKMNLWNVRSLYIKALNADSIPIPSNILTKMNRPISPRSPKMRKLLQSRA